MSQAVQIHDFDQTAVFASGPTDSDETERLRAELQHRDRENEDLRAQVQFWMGEYTRVAGELEKKMAEADESEAKAKRLERENLEARNKANYWEAQHRRAVGRMEKLKTKLQEAQGRVRELRQKVFGRKSERGSGRDAHGLLNADPNKPKRKRGGQPGHKANGRRDYSNLPKQEEYVDLPLGRQICARCGMPLALMTDTEDSQQIEIKIEVYCRVIHRRRYRRTCTCPGPRTVTAPRPAKLVPKGLYGTSVWMEVLLDKFGTQRPTARLLDSWEHAGLSLSAATVTYGLRKLERVMEPAYQALLEHNAEGDLHQADETGWPVFFRQKPKTRRRWWMWGFLSKDSVAFRIDHRHNHYVPQEHFASSPEGILLVDRAKVYKAMKQVKEGRLQLAFCWAHVRRDFLKAARGWPKLEPWALEWLQQIRELYHLNRQRRKCPAGSPEFQQQQQALEAAVESFRCRFTEALKDTKLHPACRKVMESLQNHWSGLTLFVADPRIPMDNNRKERLLRKPVLGRKNYYGSAAPWAVRLAAEMFSILATLELWNINPRTWLTWYLESYAAVGRQTVFNPEPFMPWNLSKERLAELQRPPLEPPPHVDSS